MPFGTKGKIELKVTGMTCGHCEAKIEQVVKGLPGVKKVRASRTKGLVSIVPEKSGPVDLEQVKQAVNGLGYEALE